MKDFNPFTGMAQFVMSCIILACFATLFVAQYIMAGAWMWWMWIALIIIALCVANCVTSWREYQQDK